jgi:pimeloyl-ACP methyl ester carboxylesterase
MDLQGYGGSSKPVVMDDPCNTSSDNQARYLIPNPLPAPCPPAHPHSFGSFRMDWDEMDSVVEFIRALRGEPGLRIHLIGWSRGGMRAIGYAALHPEKVDKVVAFAPTRFPPLRVDPPYPINMADRRDTFQEWDRQLDPQKCPEQADPGIRDAIWDSMMAFDEVGRRWGPSGVRRSPAFNAAEGWSPDLPGRVQAPVLVVRGELDEQAPEASTRSLYEAIRSAKVYLTVRCGSHELLHESRHEILEDASEQWLRLGTYEGCADRCSFTK